MPPSATLFNHETSTYEQVPAEDVGAAIASGRYAATGATTETQSEGGLVTRPVEQMGAAAVQNEQEAGGANAARAAAARREAQKSALSDSALSFAEGATDALTMGLMHGTREEDDIRREADSGSALLGQLVGTALGLKFPGPISGITKGGEAVGEGIARALLGEAETGFRGTVTRGLAEAGANSALMAASAFGHQVTDSVIADKPFAAESITSEAGVGAVLGFGFGFAGSAFGQLAKASRGAVEASGIMSKEARASLDSVADLTRAWDSAVEQHAQRVGVLKALSDDGHIPGDLHSSRSAALRQAEKARDALRSIDQDAALGGDPKRYQQWRDAVEKYQDAVSNLDGKMTPSMMERANSTVPVVPGESPNSAGPQIQPLNVDDVMLGKGQRTRMSDELDTAMRNGAVVNPSMEPRWTELTGTAEDFQAKYKEIYGRDYQSAHGYDIDREAWEAAGRPEDGIESLKGKRTPTSEEGTNPGSRRARGASGSAQEPPPLVEQGMTDSGVATAADPKIGRFDKRVSPPRPAQSPFIDVEGREPQGLARNINDTEVDARVGRFDKRVGKVREPRDTVIDTTEAPPEPVQGRSDSLGHQVLKAGDAPASAGETAQDFVLSAQKEMKALESGTPEAPNEPKAPKNGEGKKAVRDYLNSWFKEFDSKSRVSIGDQLHVKLSQALDSISKAGGSRLDSAGALGILDSMKVKGASSPLGQRLDQVWSLGQVGKFAADEARGIRTPLRRSISNALNPGGAVGAVERYSLRKLGRKAASAALGGSLGGPAGALIGYALTSAGFAGKAAATAGRMMSEIASVGEALLRGDRALVAARTVSGNRPYQYSDAGPTKDPVQRILEVQRMAANPDAIRARVTKQLGDMALTSPELAHHITETTTNQLMSIATSSPAIMMTPLGKPIRPSGTALERFFDFENAMHDLPGTLKAVADGSANKTQIKALQVGYPAVHAELVRGIIGHEDRLDSLEEAKLRTIEMVIGVPLTRATADPTVTSRFQGNWEAPAQKPQTPQAFKITAEKPTAVQSSSAGRAPGNERKQ